MNEKTTLNGLKFDADLGFQQEAIRAITDIFIGQKECRGASN